ncbi:hypothetical protein F5888DRAFT_1798761 [Russula emetica]|nr:hypothetical protein F5888DRAFT_1798761 [Russula emetica]
MSSPNDSPDSVHIQPLHNPQNAAQVSIPQAPLGNATNGSIVHGPGMGTKAFLAKRMAKTQNPSYVSPTDNLVTPVTQKISAARKKHFNKGKSMPIPALFGDTTANASDDEDGETIPPASSGTSGELVTADDNPF